ncbi:MAG TPA: hypothetical protein PKD86_06210 [Gemmatales bacterium]|nr:hypothetical protein [Gemmatales bacterium]HMP58929.1 hypothetical protein [Gemmatales bacterium]
MSNATPESMPPPPAPERIRPAAAANIGPRGQRQRNGIGLVVLLAAIVAGVLGIVYEVNPWIRISLFVPFFFAYLALFQAKAKTCVFLVAKGQCDLDAGRQPVTNPELQAVLRSKSRWIYGKSIVAAIVWTFLFFVLEKDWWQSLQQQPVVIAPPAAAPPSRPGPLAVPIPGPIAAPAPTTQPAEPEPP